MKRVLKIGGLLLGLVVGLVAFSSAQVNTLGKDFYIGFFENGRTLDSVNTAPEKALILITAAEKTVGTIQTPRQSISFNLEKGQQFISELDANSEGLIHPMSAFVDDRAIRVTSSGLVAVHALNGRAYSSDGTVVLPVSALGLDYMVFTHHERINVTNSTLNHTTLESTMMIVAAEDDTEVEVLTSARTQNGFPANYRFTINLNAGQTYQLKSDEDLSGTRVKVLNDPNSNCKKVAVFAGNRMTSAAICGTTGDHLYQQAYPTNTWGKSFVHVPLKDRTSGEFVKILALEDQTEIKVNGQSRGRINSGEQLRLEFGKNELALIETSKPSSAAVLSKSGFCNEFFAASLGDPTFFIYAPNEQRIKEAYFSTGRLYGRFNLSIAHLVNVVIPKGTAKATFLDGQSIAAQFDPIPNSDFEFAQIQVSEGAHVITNPEGLIGYIYGSGQIESYGYSIGTNLQSIQYEADAAYGFEVIGEKVACLDQEGTWKMEPENPIFTQFSWDFDDGSPIQDGQEVTHTFTKSGKYLISVFASSGSGRCDEEERFQFEVEVKGAEGTLSGPQSVCPAIDEVDYVLSDTLNLSQVTWEVRGGTILSESLTSVKVKWGTANSNAEIIATLFNEENCPSLPITLQIEITEDINPQLPVGDSGICGGASVLTYSVPFPNPNRTYTWSVTGGIIRSGQNSSQIEIDWDLSAPVKSLFYEEKSTLNSGCIGVSPILEVEIYPPLQIMVLEELNPACPGESNGRIELLATGGSGEYRFTWSDDPERNAAKAENLPSGSYEIVVEDLTGCAQEVVTVELTEPQPLSLSAAPEVKSVVCHAEATGEVILTLTGGNPPFQVQVLSSVWDGNELKVTSLAAGKQELFVEDSRGCILPILVEIPDQEPISVIARVENPGCEGSLDGVLELEISGGVGPYEIIWADGRTGARIDELSFGSYFYTVTDTNGCVLSGEAVVNQARPILRMPTGFDPRAGAYGPVSNCTISYEMWIWNRWGGLIFTGTDGWNGLVDGKLAPQGSYSFRIQYSYLLEGVRTTSEQSGIFTLIR